MFRTSERRAVGARICGAPQRSYAEGLAPDWQQNSVLACATVHPREDLAETAPHYLHIVGFIRPVLDLTKAGKPWAVPGGLPGPRRSCAGTPERSGFRPLPPADFAVPRQDTAPSARPTNGPEGVPPKGRSSRKTCSNAS
ncbi:putative zinc-binding metallopeptidase [Bradyrhizobium manausense]|uniref:putative zinc-binding metallopeptidase n=1 Tax=Bradyrhizobium manausense TaxID=989370 RepID=UPI001BA6EA29|nr:putative zinc-binding metallopeptidase [Bradyrhizobium manausense]